MKYSKIVRTLSLTSKPNVAEYQTLKASNVKSSKTHLTSVKEIKPLFQSKNKSKDLKSPSASTLATINRGPTFMFVGALQAHQQKEQIIEP